MTVLTDKRGALTVLTINRPERMNALDVHTMKLLNKQLAAFRDDPAQRVLVITGAGERSFCVGADLRDTDPPAESFARALFSDYESAVADGNYLRALSIDDLRIGKPMIAAINGFAVGGGLELALACDIRITTPGGAFGLPEVKWATVPGFGGVQRLLRAVSPSLAMHMLLTGELIDSDRALAAGLVSEVVDDTMLLARACEIGEAIAANGPLAVRAVKLAADAAGNVPMREAIALEGLLWGLLRDSADRIEGRRAFQEKRHPSYRGC